MKLKEIISNSKVPEGYILVVSKDYFSKIDDDSDIDSESCPPFYITKIEDFYSDAFDNLVLLFPININEQNQIPLDENRKMRYSLNIRYEVEFNISMNKSKLIAV